jgi:hypothetical protein
LAAKKGLGRDINPLDSESEPEDGRTRLYDKPRGKTRQGRVKSGVPAVRGRGDGGRLLLDPHRMRSDLQLVFAAVTKGYNVRRKTMLRRRLEAIANKEQADVVVKGKEGCSIVYSESKADELAIAATKILVAMDQADMKRLEVFKDPPKQDPPGVEVNINVNSETDGRRSSLIELAQRLGAREILIDGRAIDPRTGLESIGSVSEESGTDQSTESTPSSSW